MGYVYKGSGAGSKLWGVYQIGNVIIFIILGVGRTKSPWGIGPIWFDRRDWVTVVTAFSFFSLQCEGNQQCMIMITRWLWILPDFRVCMAFDRYLVMAYLQHSFETYTELFISDRVIPNRVHVGFGAKQPIIKQKKQALIAKQLPEHGFCVDAPI